MEVFHYKEELINGLERRKKPEHKLGFVPTMGALHEGHFSLIEKAQEQTDLVVVSIFINPTQFDNSADLAHYPKNLDRDLARLQKRFGRLLVFAPNAKEVYGDSITAESFDFGLLATKMEGKSRRGHFDGVGTVLKKLFSIIKPDKAFFGEKDYQQFLIVKKLISLLQWPITVVGCPINREENGLARSSRNKHLSKESREKATLLHKSLKLAQKHFGSQSFADITEAVKEGFRNHPDFTLDYFEIADAETLTTAQNFEKNKKYRAFIAARIEKVRLIDNMALN